MFANVSPSALAVRFNAVAERFAGSTTADRAEMAQRKLMAAVSALMVALTACAMVVLDRVYGLDRVLVGRK